MSTLTESAPSAVPARTGESPYRLSFPRLVRSEWMKFVTLRSTWWSFAVVAVMAVGLSLLMAASMGSITQEDPAMSVATANQQAMLTVVFSTVLTQLLAVMIGTIAVTGEYSTGMIRSTLTANPGRIGSELAKALVVGASLFVGSFALFIVAALVTAPMLPAGGLDFSHLDSSLMPLLGGALYLGLIAMIGVGVGFIIRNGPGALATGIGLVFVAPLVVSFFPRNPDFEWLHTLASYLPSNAGQSLFMGAPMSGDTLEMWPAIITLVLWAVAALAGGAAVLKLRDA